MTTWCITGKLECNTIPFHRLNLPIGNIYADWDQSWWNCLLIADLQEKEMMYFNLSTMQHKFSGVACNWKRWKNKIPSHISSYHGMQGTVFCITKNFKCSIHVFPILCWICLISRIRWIQLESVKHDWRLLKTFLCLPFTVCSLE